MPRPGVRCSINFRRCFPHIRAALRHICRCTRDFRAQISQGAFPPSRGLQADISWISATGRRRRLYGRRLVSARRACRRNIFPRRRRRLRTRGCRLCCISEVRRRNRRGGSYRSSCARRRLSIGTPPPNIRARSEWYIPLPRPKGPLAPSLCAGWKRRSRPRPRHRIPRRLWSRIPLTLQMSTRLSGIRPQRQTPPRRR